MDHLYADIAARTGGNIYIGVVGPVRTGKSTFIKRFMEQLVIPGIAPSPTPIGQTVRGMSCPKAHPAEPS